MDWITLSTLTLLILLACRKPIQPMIKQILDSRRMKQIEKRILEGWTEEKRQLSGSDDTAFMQHIATTLSDIELEFVFSNLQYLQNKRIKTLIPPAWSARNLHSENPWGVNYWKTKNNP